MFSIFFYIEYWKKKPKPKSLPHVSLPCIYSYPGRRSQNHRRVLTKSVRILWCPFQAVKLRLGLDKHTQLESPRSWKENKNGSNQSKVRPRVTLCNLEKLIPRNQLVYFLFCEKHSFKVVEIFFTIVFEPTLSPKLHLSLELAFLLELVFFRYQNHICILKNNHA